MKKIIYVLGAFTFALTSCGGGAEETTGGTDSTATAETVETPIDNSILDPLKDDLSQPIAAADLVKSMNVYYGKEVQLVVYPNIFTEGTMFTQDLVCAGSYSGEPYAFGQEKNVYVKFVTVPGEAIVAGQAYLIKGTIESLGYWKELMIVDAELLPLPADYKIEPFNPKSMSATAYYNPIEISNCMMGWDKKIITVTGDYNGTTVSKSYDQTKLLDARVDVGAASDEYKVGCSFATEAETEEFTASMGIVTIKGECSAWTTFGSPSLKNCVRVQ